MKKKERRGCLGTNDPFNGNSYGVCHETPAPCSPCHSFPRHLVTHFHSASGMLLWWALPLWAGNSLFCVLLTCAPQSTQQHSGVLQTPRLCLLEFHSYGPGCNSHVHSKWYLARCTKLPETLFHRKGTSSPLFQFISIWKSPSGGSYVGCLFSGHGLTLIWDHRTEAPSCDFWLKGSQRSILHSKQGNSV